MEKNNMNGVSTCKCKENGSTFPPGYEFDPTDEELVVEYLKKKIMNESFQCHEIMQHKFLDINIYTELRHPDMLEEIYKLGPGEKKWFIFTPRDKKDQNGKRPSRSAGAGYWKSTSGDKAIRVDGVTVANKKCLAFFTGNPSKGDKSKWLMHEYTIPGLERKTRNREGMRLDDCVLCKIYKKEAKKEEEQEPLFEEPLIEEPIFEEPLIEEPMFEEPMIEEPLFEEPMIEEPLFEEPLFDLDELLNIDYDEFLNIDINELLKNIDKEEHQQAQQPQPPINIHLD